MTIIVYRDGVMASDSFAWDGNYVTDQFSPKVFKIRGHLLGVCGARSVTHRAVDIFRRTGKFDPAGTTEEHQVLIVKPNGRAICMNYGCIEDYVGPYHVLGGSAMGVALGALHMGASAIRAVRISIKISAWVGGEIQKVRL